MRAFPSNATPQETHGFTSCSQWTGVLLSLLLKEAGVQKSATWIIAEGADEPKHSKSIPIGKALDDALVAYGQNGEPVRPEQGFPLRLIVPGWQGINNVKWLRRSRSGGRALHGHDGNKPLPQHEAGRQIALVRIRTGTKVRNYAARRRIQNARPRLP